MTDTLRNCIISSPGYTFLALDASQIELRVLAILSQDTQMLADLATGDLHLASAIRIAQLKGEDIDWIDNPDKAAERKKRRYDAKQCNFAVVYGADEFKLSQMMECSQAEAAEFMALHRQSYPQLYAWMDAQVEQARLDGFVVNMFGRIRPIANLTSSNRRLREDAEREVVNTKIQGGAIDIIKQAMLIMRSLLDKAVRLVLNVHDEMVFEVPDELLPQAISTAKSLADYFPQYPFSISVGKVYGSMEELKEEDNASPQ